MTKILLADSGQPIDNHGILMLDSWKSRHQAVVNSSHFALPYEVVVMRHDYDPHIVAEMEDPLNS